jgi:hypothetical protein
VWRFISCRLLRWQRSGVSDVSLSMSEMKALRGLLVDCVDYRRRVPLQLLYYGLVHCVCHYTVPADWLMGMERKPAQLCHCVCGPRS